MTWTLDQGLTGIENLALIPGSVGAAPIQNIGAYGVELASVVDSVTAWDWIEQCWVILNCAQCRFSYRDSLFKSVEPDRYFITSLRLKLKQKFSPCIEYTDLAKELAELGIKTPTAKNVYDAIIRIRKRKLPDPAITGNAGSFFKNPIVTTDELEQLKTRFPSLPSWPTQDGLAKVSAAWMIQKCDLKGYCQNEACISDRHALVIVNQGNAGGEEIWQLACHIRETVYQRFGMKMQIEPRVYAFNISS